MTTPVYTCRQYRLLIAGSRHANAEMLQTARQVVARAQANGWMVLVGDNPQGVDAAVIDTCDEVGVNVMVFGVAAQPRKGSKRPSSYWRVDTRFEHDDDYVPGKAYTERDRYMIDLCDRAFFIHDGLSRGTKAGYDYAVSLAKPTDIRVFAATNKPKSNKPSLTPFTKPAASVPHIIELVIDVSEGDDAHCFGGSFGLRALDGQGHSLYDAQQTLRVEANTVDGARMQAIIVGLERLISWLKTDTAAYRLRVYQTSKNVDGWLAHHWKRNVPEVQRLAGRIDTLLHTFPETEWIKEPRPQVQSRLSKIGKGGDVRQPK
ncbi:MAG: hypothetical protein ABI947_22905 [Chloroflexota bacterium]